MFLPIIATASPYWPFAILAISIAAVIVMISVLRVHAFIALILAAFLAGFLTTEDSQRDADLCRRQTNARCRVHGLDHVVDEPLDLRSDFADRCGRRMQHVGSVADDGSNHQAECAANRRRMASSVTS